MNELLFFEREFEIRFLKSRGTAFQDLFAELMERAHSADFQRIRTHGNTGDLKCDGYLQSQRTVFQLYGPDEIRSLSRLLTKVKEDYRGAGQHWAGLMDRWVFVHNSFGGLPAQAVQLLDTFRRENGAPRIEQWGFQELCNILRQVPPERLRTLLPGSQPGEAERSAENLPDCDEIRRYLAWASKHFQDPPLPRHLAILATLNLPLRLITPNDADAWRSAEEQEVGHGGEWRPPTLEPVERNGKHSRSVDLIYALRQFRRVLVVGESGSGKSTLLRRFAKAQSDRKYTRGFVRGSGRTPILVELWRFGQERTLVDLVVTSINRAGGQMSEEQLRTALRRGYLTLLLDGLDEVAPGQRRRCQAQILDLAEGAPRTWIVVTSRPFPEPPDYFHQLEVAPLSDMDLEVAFCTPFGSPGEFRKRFRNLPVHYIQSGLRPQVRQLCRRPLTLAFVLNLLCSDGRLPETLHGIYDRILEWLLDWERSRGRLPSVVAGARALEEVAYQMRYRNQLGLAMSEWVEVAGQGIHQLRPSVSVREVDAEQLLELFLSSGLLNNSGGEISFPHRSILDFLAARRIKRSVTQIPIDPVALNPGVGIFLCGSLWDVGPLLEEYYRNCDNMEELRALLEEARDAECDMGRFKGVWETIEMGEEWMSVHLSHSVPTVDDDEFSAMVDLIVTTCIAFKPTMLAPLKGAATAIVWSVQWTKSRHWFERILAGLEQYGWPGTSLHRLLLEAGLFEKMDRFGDDGTDEAAADRWERLSGYLRAVEDDDFARAAAYATRLKNDLKD